MIASGSGVSQGCVRVAQKLQWYGPIEGCRMTNGVVTSLGEGGLQGHLHGKEVRVGGVRSGVVTGAANSSCPPIPLFFPSHSPHSSPSWPRHPLPLPAPPPFHQMPTATPPGTPTAVQGLAPPPLTGYLPSLPLMPRQYPLLPPPPLTPRTGARSRKGCHSPTASPATTPAAEQRRQEAAWKLHPSHLPPGPLPHSRSFPAPMSLPRQDLRGKSGWRRGGAHPQRGRGQALTLSRCALTPHPSRRGA